MASEKNRGNGTEKTFPSRKRSTKELDFKNESTTHIPSLIGIENITTLSPFLSLRCHGSKNPEFVELISMCSFL